MNKLVSIHQTEKYSFCTKMKKMRKRNKKLQAQKINQEVTQSIQKTQINLSLV